MAISDNHYLSLQFWNRVLKNNATEYQRFFEDIMGKAFPDFIKIRPYGREGDGGNDGYIPNKGAYYQVYSPKNPKEKDAAAANKMKEDFNKLKLKWDQISKLKTYYFVFNDKDSGSSFLIEQALAELRKDNPEVEIKLFCNKDLEGIFLNLKNDDFISLGFDDDLTKAVSMAADYFNVVKTELDRENGKSAIKALDNFKSIIAALQNEDLQLTYDLLKARALQKLEKINDSKHKYENLCIKHPNDPRAFLYLAEIYLSIDEFDKNEELIKTAEKIDSTHWLLPLEKLIRGYRLDNTSDIKIIDESAFPTDPRIKSDYYRLYSLLIEKAGDQIKTDSFIGKAIHFNPNSFSNHEIELSILENRMFSQNTSKEDLKKAALELLSKLDAIQNKGMEYGELRPRILAILNARRIDLLRIQEHYLEIEKVAQECFELIMQCYLDHLIEQLIVNIFMFIDLPQKELDRLLKYLQNADKIISDELAKVIIMQFIYKNTLETEGIIYFENINKPEYVDFINNIKIKNYDKVLPYILKDIQFAINIIIVAKSYLELRRKIMESLPEDKSIQKDKLLLLLNYGEGNIEEAFSILKTLDLTKLNYGECGPALEVAKKMKAWEFVIIILEKLLKYEKDNEISLQIKLNLFTANINLERFKEVIIIGKGIISSSVDMELLSNNNKETLIANTTYALMRRGGYKEAKSLIERYGSSLTSFEAKVSIEAEVYLKNNDPKNALRCVVEAVRILERPSPIEYGSLFLIFSQIGTLMDFQLVSMDKVEINSFVKLKDQEKWLFIGDNDELDAIMIPPEKGNIIVNKKLGERILFDNKYSSESNEREIEYIFNIDKYILWQSVHNAQQLSVDRLWDKMEVIEVPTTEKGIDTKYLVARLEDQDKKGKKLFEAYCEQNVPLALLAISEGGLTNAIGRISNEGRGFINAVAGSKHEMEQQKEVARQIISGELFYIDGTSALILSENGLLEKIHKYLPNFKVPQSVISLLLDVENKFRYTPGQVGYMNYSHGKIGFSSINISKRTLIQNNIENSLKILEAESKSIEAISSASKLNVISEQKVPPDLCDACILAQRDNVPILTEDFLYLQMNALETGKVAPKYCSSFAIIKVLYEQKKINFDEYLNFFAYLSFYRFRFLSITVEDLEKAVFGDGLLKIIRTNELRKYNFPLTLSEEYGVTGKMASGLVGSFLIRLLIDDSIMSQVVEKVFVEIISTFPTSQDKKVFGKSLLIGCVQVINKNSQNIILETRIQEKIDLLTQFIQVYNSGAIIMQGVHP